jgi:hypothetical protein
MTDEIGIAEQDAGSVIMGTKDGDRLARLDEERFVTFECAKRLHDGVKAIPIASRFPGAAVDDQILRFLGDFGVEIIQEHAESRLLLPTLAGKFAAARCAKGTTAGGGVIDYGCGGTHGWLPVGHINPGGFAGGNRGMALKASGLKGLSDSFQAKSWNA